MKRFISIVTVICMLLACGALFSSCKKDENNGQTVEKYTSTSKKETATNEDGNVIEMETVILDVTDKEGNDQTTVVEYSVMGGSDPYVEDIF